MGGLDACRMDNLEGDVREFGMCTRADAGDNIDIMHLCRTIKRKSGEILIDRRTPLTGIG